MSLIDEICEAWRHDKPLDTLLSRFVEQTDSRASGIWRLVDDHLVLAGFGWADDMPDEVSQGFQDATRRVSLEQTGLGIVKAAVTRQPAIGRRDANATGLSGSASWIEKFAANTSLAIPIQDFDNAKVLGVAAVSTVAFVEPNDSLWKTIHLLAAQLGRSTNSRL